MVRAHLALTCSLRDDNKEVCDILKTSRCRVGVRRGAPAPLTMAVCVVFLCLKVTCNEQLARTDPQTPRATVSATVGEAGWGGGGAILGIAGYLRRPCEVHSKVICYKHTTHLDSLDNPNEVK